MDNSKCLECKRELHDWTSGLCWICEMKTYKCPIYCIISSKNKILAWTLDKDLIPYDIKYSVLEPSEFISRLEQQNV